MHRTLLLAGALSLLGACKSNKDPTELAADAAGSYYGRLFVTSYRNGSSVIRAVDTTLQVTMTGATTLDVFKRQLTYTTSQASWLGHKPTRNHYSFENGYGYSNGIILQKETTGDSIYIDFRSGGLSYGRYYQFYARK